MAPEEIAGFYAQNLARFDTPERIGVFRILCSSEAEAKEVIAVARGSSGLTRWKELARDKSLDKATAYRSGNLGFLAADGTSSEVSVRVDPALFAAASRVRDGEIVAEPVAEGPAFAVVWRRGSTPASASHAGARDCRHHPSACSREARIRAPRTAENTA